MNNNFNTGGNIMTSRSVINYCESMIIAEEGLINRIKNLFSKKDSSNDNQRSTSDHGFIHVVYGFRKEDYRRNIEHQMVKHFKSDLNIKMEFVESFIETDNEFMVFIFRINVKDKTSVDNMVRVKVDMGCRWFEDYYFQSFEYIPNDIWRKYWNEMRPMAYMFDAAPYNGKWRIKYTEVFGEDPTI